MALAVPLALVQLVLSVEPQLTNGLVVALVTTASQLAVQPVDKSVTTTVYVPADSPLILDVVSPLFHK